MKRTPFTLLAAVLLIALPAAAQDAQPAQETSKDAKSTDSFSTQPQGSTATKQDKDPLQSNHADDPKKDNSSTDPFQSSGGSGGFGGGFPGGGGFPSVGAFGGGIPVTAQRMISGGNLIISWSQKNDQLRGFSLSDGSWTNLEIAPQKGLIPVVGDTVAAVKIQDGMAAFSAEKRRWDILTLAPSSKALPAISNDLVTVQEGDHMYTFAASSGRWTSPTDPRFQMVTTSLIMPASSEIGSQSQRQFIESQSIELNLSVVLKNGVIEVSGASQDVETFKRRLKGHFKPAERLPLASKRRPSSSDLTAPLRSPRNAASKTGLSLPGVASTTPKTPSTFFTPGKSSLSFTARSSVPFHSATFGASKKEKATLDLARTLKGKPIVEADRGKLKALVASALDERLKAQQKSVEELRKKLKAVEDKLDTKKENRDRIIERRVEELLNPDLDWETAFSSGNFFQPKNRLPALATGPPLAFPSVGGTFQGQAVPGPSEPLSPAKSLPSPKAFPNRSESPGDQLPSQRPPSPFSSNFRSSKPSQVTPSNALSGTDSSTNQRFQAKGEFGGQVRQIRKQLSEHAENFRAVQAEVKQRSQQLEAGKGTLLAARKRAAAPPEDDLAGFAQSSLDSLTALVQQVEASLQAVVSRRDRTLADWQSTWSELERLRNLQAQRVAVAEQTLQYDQSRLERTQVLVKKQAMNTASLQQAKLEVSRAELQLQEIMNQLESMDEILKNRDDLKPPSSAKMKKQSTSSKLDDGDLPLEAGADKAKD